MGERITEILSSYKGSLEQWLLPLILVLVGLSAFGLGRLSVIGEQGPRLIIKLPDGTTETAAAYAASAPNVSAPAAKVAGEYVASKSGSKYYPVGCGAANRIKEENKVYFTSASDAQAAGYEPAANC